MNRLCNATRCTLIVLVGLFAFPLAATSAVPDCTVVINEFVSAAQTHHADEDGDYPDWIELYNCTDQPIALKDWGLSDRANDPFQWTFPEISIGAAEFLVVLASGKNRRRSDARLHTNFKINASGEALYLTSPTDVRIDATPPLVLGADQAAGRYPDGVGPLHYLVQPTPGAPNAKTAGQATVTPPTFSQESGFFDEPFKLKLTHSDQNLRIFYTLDGSEPDPDNLEGTTYRYKNEYAQPPNLPSDEFLEAEYRTYAYKSAIKIRDRRYEPDRIARISTTFDGKPDYFPEPILRDTWSNQMVDYLNAGINKLNGYRQRVSRKWHKIRTGEVRSLRDKQYYPLIPYVGDAHEYLYKGTVVRAVSVLEKEGQRVISPIATHTYFIGQRDAFDLPIIAITIPEKDLFDYDDGVFVAGKDYDEWLLGGEDVTGAAHHRPANWKRRGSDVRAHLSIFDNINNDVVSRAVDARLHGAASRSFPIKSFRIYPRAKYSPDGLPYDIFDTATDVGFNRLILRNAGQEYRRTFVKDATAQRIMAGLNVGTQRYAPVIAFLNGEYYGLLNARDRMDHYYLGDSFRLPSRNVDLLEKNKTIKRGNIDHWNEVDEYIKQAPKSDLTFLSELAALIDVESFIDYQASSIFMNRTDWPGNNIAYWRYRDTNASNVKTTTSTDGRWRWLMFDVDTALDAPDHNTLAFSTEAGNTAWPNPDWSTIMLRTLLENAEFRARFIIRFSDLMNSTFQSPRMIAIIRQMQAVIEPEMPRHIHRWSAPSSMTSWRQSMDNMIAFVKERPTQQHKHLQGFFGLGAPNTLSVDVVDASVGSDDSDKRIGTVRVNTITLGLKDDEIEKPVGASESAVLMEDVLALPWSGQYFKEIPVQLEAFPAPGYRFSHWVGPDVPSDQAEKVALTLELKRDLSITAVMVPVNR